jgi:tetratricopeptide (TPR) repeat protein
MLLAPRVSGRAAPLAARVVCLLAALLPACGESAPPPPWEPSAVEAALPDVADALEAGSSQQALDLLNARAVGKPLPDGAEHLRALALSDLGRTREAEDAWKRQLQAHPGDGRGHALLGMLLLDGGKAEEAAPHLALAQALASRDPVVQFVSGHVALLQHDDETASRSFRDSLTGDPFGRLAADAHRALAQIGARAGPAGKADADQHEQTATRLTQLRGRLAAGERQLVQHPADAEAAYSVATAWLDLYVSMGRDSRLRATAERALAAVLALKADDARALYNLGFLRVEEGRSSEAQDLFRKSLAVAPDFAAPRQSLGMLLATLGRGEEARAEFQRIIDGKAGPDDIARARLQLAEQYEHGTDPGDRDRAIEQYRALLELYPDDRLGVKPSLDKLLAKPADAH